VGAYAGAKGRQHGFLLSGGDYTNIDDPNGQFTEPRGINDGEEIVGSYDDNVGRHGFLRSGQQYRTLDDPNAVGLTQVCGINDFGQIVGQYDDLNGTHAFLAIPIDRNSAYSSTAASVSLAPALQTASATDFAPLASSLLNAGQPSVQASPPLGLATLPASRPSPTVVLPTARSTAALSARAADAVFAGSHAETHDDAALLLSSSSNLEAM
jgi:hypothetical protein